MNRISFLILECDQQIAALLCYAMAAMAGPSWAMPDMFSRFPSLDSYTLTTSMAIVELVPGDPTFVHCSGLRVTSSHIIRVLHDTRYIMNENENSRKPKKS
jgi:hypothetical protein